jgi:hypothetical protein
MESEDGSGYGGWDTGRDEHEASQLVIRLASSLARRGEAALTRTRSPRPTSLAELLSEGISGVVQVTNLLRR